MARVKNDHWAAVVVSQVGIECRLETHLHINGTLVEKQVGEAQENRIWIKPDEDGATVCLLNKGEPNADGVVVHNDDIPRNLTKYDISNELWREYEWDGRHTPYRINAPVTLYLRKGGSTHRVVDSNGVAHCMPAVGDMGCVLRWKNPTGEAPVDF